MTAMPPRSRSAGWTTGSWELYTAPCGLAQLVRRPEEIYTDTDTEHVYIQLILSSDDAPLYFNYQNDLGQGATLADDAVAQYCALLGLDEFTDWQYPEWGTARAGLRCGRLQ